jgi:guanylate kinase
LTAVISKGKGDLFVVSAPSGAGKTTLCLRLLEMLPDIAFSVSYTTRSPRQGEIDGRDYYFVSRQRFDNMVSACAFLEWAEVHGNFYGTGRSEVSQRLEHGKDVLLDIDVEGAKQVRRLFPQATLIFVLPPSWSALEQRLKGRRSEDAQEVEIRLADARSEVQTVRGYDFIIINNDDDVAHAAENLKSIVVAQRCRAFRVLASLDMETLFGPGFLVAPV